MSKRKELRNLLSIKNDEEFRQAVVQELLELNRNILNLRLDVNKESIKLLIYECHKDEVDRLEKLKSDIVKYIRFCIQKGLYTQEEVNSAIT
jgi:hypothetical protein